MEEARRRAGVRGELKWRRIKRRGGADLLAALFEAAVVRHVALHFADAKSFEGAVVNQGATSRYMRARRVAVKLFRISRQQKTFKDGKR